jgi:general secretion pathway protein G
MTGKGPKKFQTHDAVILAVVCAVGLIIVLEVLTRAPDSPADQARYLTAQQQVQRLEAAARAYLHTHGALPPSLEALVPTFLEAVPLDPWGRPYGYRRYAQEAHMWCNGRDGRQGHGYGVDVDIRAVIRLPNSAQ